MFFRRSSGSPQHHSDDPSQATNVSPTACHLSSVSYDMEAQSASKSMSNISEVPNPADSPEVPRLRFRDGRQEADSRILKLIKGRSVLEGSAYCSTQQQRRRGDRQQRPANRGSKAPLEESAECAKTTTVHPPTGHTGSACGRIRQGCSAEVDAFKDTSPVKAAMTGGAAVASNCHVRSDFLTTGQHSNNAAITSKSAQAGDRQSQSHLPPSREHGEESSGKAPKNEAIIWMGRSKGSTNSGSARIPEGPVVQQQHHHHDHQHHDHHHDHEELHASPSDQPEQLHQHAPRQLEGQQQQHSPQQDHEALEEQHGSEERQPLQQQQQQHHPHQPHELHQQTQQQQLQEHDQQQPLASPEPAHEDGTSVPEDERQRETQEDQSVPADAEPPASSLARVAAAAAATGTVAVSSGAAWVCPRPVEAPQSAALAAGVAATGADAAGVAAAGGVATAAGTASGHDLMSGLPAWTIMMQNEAGSLVMPHTWRYVIPPAQEHTSSGSRGPLASSSSSGLLPHPSATEDDGIGGYTANSAAATSCSSTRDSSGTGEAGSTDTAASLHTDNAGRAARIRAKRQLLNSLVQRCTETVHCGEHALATEQRQGRALRMTLEVMQRQNACLQQQLAWLTQGYQQTLAATACANNAPPDPTLAG